MSPGSRDDERAPLLVDQGLPDSWLGWPAGARERLKRFVQGDLVPRPPLFYFADANAPVWQRTRAYTPDAMPGGELVLASPQSSPHYGLITTQTCDIAEEDAERPVRPWVQLAPVYDMAHADGGLRSLLRSGRGPAYLLHLPALSAGFWVVDFRIEVPVEKGWLAAQEPTSGFADEEAQRAVGRRLAHLRERPAFAGLFVSAVQRPLLTALRALRTADRDLFGMIDGTVREVLVELDSYLAPTSARLTLVTTERPNAAISNWFEHWWDTATADLPESFILAPLRFKLENEITLTEYRRMTPLPLDRISP